MDTLGAVISSYRFIVPALYPGAYKPLFYIAFIPGIISVLLIYLLKEKKKYPLSPNHLLASCLFAYWKDPGLQAISYRVVTIRLIQQQ